MEPPDPGNPFLHRLSADEFSLIKSYRSCCPEHKQNIRWFVYVALSRCMSQSEDSVIPFPAARN